MVGCGWPILVWCLKWKDSGRGKLLFLQSSATMAANTRMENILSSLAEPCGYSHLFFYSQLSTWGPIVWLVATSLPLDVPGAKLGSEDITKKRKPSSPESSSITEKGFLLLSKLSMEVIQPLGNRQLLLSLVQKLMLGKSSVMGTAWSLCSCFFLAKRETVLCMQVCSYPWYSTVLHSSHIDLHSICAADCSVKYQHVVFS